MTEEEFIRFIGWLMTLNEDACRDMLAAADERDLINARGTLKATHDRINRELMRRGWISLTEVPS